MEDIPVDGYGKNPKNIAGSFKAYLNNSNVSEQSRTLAQRKLMMMGEDSSDDSHTLPRPSYKHKAIFGARRSSLSPSASSQERNYSRIRTTPVPAHITSKGDEYSLYQTKDGPTQDYSGPVHPGNVARRRKVDLINPCTKQESKTKSKEVSENQLDDIPSGKLSTTYLKVYDRGIGPSYPPFISSTTRPSTPIAPLHTIISLQNITGFWSSSDQLAQLLSLKKKLWKEATRRTGTYGQRYWSLLSWKRRYRRARGFGNWWLRRRRRGWIKRGMGHGGIWRGRQGRL